MDEKAEKFSKSKGNALSPAAIVDRLGADILRLWVASVDYTSDVGLSDALLKQVSENYRKIRNTMRFMHGNSSDLNREDRLELNSLPASDRYVLHEVDNVLRKGIKNYRNFDFSDVLTDSTKLFTNIHVCLLFRLHERHSFTFMERMTCDAGRFRPRSLFPWKH